MGLGGILRNIVRAITFGFVFGDYKSDEAIASLWTQSPDTIRAAFQKRREKMITWLRGLEETYGQAVQIMKRAEGELKQIDKGLEEALPRRDEAVRQYNAAKAAGNKERIATLETLFTTVDGEVQRLEERKAKLLAQVEENRARATAKKQEYLDFQAKVGELESSEADAINDFITAKTDVEFADQTRRFKADGEKDEVDFVMDRINKLSARAAVVKETAGANLASEYAKLDQDARHATSASRLSQMSAALDAANKVQTGAAESERTPASADRTQI